VERSIAQLPRQTLTFHGMVYTVCKSVMAMVCAIMTLDAATAIMVMVGWTAL